MKKVALLVYPEFSLQEVMNLSGLFRWDFEMRTEVIATDKAPVKSEEGIFVLPERTTEEFAEDEYACLILPGCSDFTESIRDEKLSAFLRSLKTRSNLLIGAICSGPLHLAKAGLLEGKKFAASFYMDFFDFLPYLEKENYVAAPVAVDGNIVTACGGHFNGFAVTIARQLGFACPEKIYSGYMEGQPPEAYHPSLPAEALAEIKAVFGDDVTEGKKEERERREEG